MVHFHFIPPAKWNTFAPAFTPVEIGTWYADPMALRKRYGKELKIIGDYNKLVLEKGPEAIDTEIKRRLPLMKEGGFVLMPDHLVTPALD